jgi:hypothetical protein
MTLNITHWKVKELDGLRIPLATLEELGESSDGEVWIDRKNDHVQVGGLAEGFDLGGVVAGPDVIVDELDYWGEFSGSSFAALKGLLERSTGRLRAKMIWESGDEEILTVDDGEVTVEEVP